MRWRVPLIAVLIPTCLLAQLVDIVPAGAAPVPSTSCQVFPADNIWNTDISALPVHARSPQWLASMNSATTNLHPDFGGPPYGFPSNVVDNSHPLVSIAFQYASESDAGPYPVGADTRIESGSDRHALIINRDTCTLYELFDLAGSGSSWTAGSGAIFNLSSNALRPLGWTSADAAGLPMFPGLVRLDEVQAGAINHAIRFTAVQTDRSFLWPARHQAGAAANPSLPPMGARFRLKASFDITRFSAQAQVILKAMQHYGLFLADNGSNWFFSGTQDAGWPDSLLSEMKSVPASQFEAVDESSLMVDPNSAATVAPTPSAAEVTTRVSNQQYTLTGSDGSTWRDLDPYQLSALIQPKVTSLAYISANADLWTAQAGYNQDLGIAINGTLSAWKESGGFAGTFSPNAAYLQHVVELQAGVQYSIRLQWKTNIPAPGATIFAGAGLLGNFSPTRLTVHLVPKASGNLGLSSSTQYRLTASNGLDWQAIDPANLTATVTAPADGAFILGGNADLWTAQAGYNQDLGIAVNGSVVAWKESGGFAGTFSPNAAYVQAVYPVKANTPYTLDLRWKTNKPQGAAAIFSGAGPEPGKFSPTSLAVKFVPAAAVIDRSTSQQYVLRNSDGRTWTDLDPALSYTFTPAVSCVGLILGNADLWTVNAGYNQDLGITVNGQVTAWKESGGFAGTFSPNAAAVQAVQPLAAGTAYTVKLQWKTNRPDPGTIEAGAGLASPFSPTRLTIQLVSCG
jgi:hypothetical protein